MGLLLDRLRREDEERRQRSSLLDRLRAEDEAAANQAAPTEDIGFGDQLARVGRALGAGVYSLGATVPGLVEMAAESPYTPLHWLGRASEAITPDSIDGGVSWTDSLAGGARALRQSLQRGAAEMAPDPTHQSFREAVADRPVGALAEGIAQSAPSTAAALAATYFSGGAAAPLLTTGIMEGVPAYGESRDAGIAPGQASLGATAQGLVSGSLETLGAGAILNRVPGLNPASRLGRLALGALGEGVTETGQELVDVTRQASQGLDTGDVGDRLLAAGTLGTLTGGIFSVPSVVAGGPPGDPAPQRERGEVSALRRELDAERERRNVAEREARTDQLTGVMNRRAWDEVAPQVEADPNAWVVLYDANNFGQINKRAGHAAGDSALVEVGRHIRDVTGDYGKVYRYGGDEFVQVVYGDRDLAEAVRDATEQGFGERDYGAGVPISISGNVGQTREEADALLQARKAERKRLATPEAAPPVNAAPEAPGGLASVGGFNTDLSEQGRPRVTTAPVGRTVLEMPELVELSQELLGGKLPVVKQRLAGKATGRFKPGTGDIELVADAFKDLPSATALIAHEVGHVVDWLPDQTLARGNILGRLKSVKREVSSYISALPDGVDMELTPDLKKQLAKAARRELSDERGAIPAADQIEQEVKRRIASERGPAPAPLTAEQVKGLRAELRRREADRGVRLSPQERSEMLEQMKFELRGPRQQRLSKDRIRQIRADVRKEMIPARVTRDQFAERYQRKVQEWVAANGQVSKKAVLDELLQLSDQWRPGLLSSDPSTPYGKYRRDGKELYADAVSALFNAPSWAKQQAPLFFRSFEAYLGNKPDVQANYERLQALSAGPDQDLLDHRAGRIQDMLERGREKRAAQLAGEVRDDKITFGQVRESAARLFIDKRAAMYTLRRASRKAGSTKADNVLRIAEQGDYLTSQQAGYAEGVVREVIAPLEAAGVDAKTFSEWLHYRRTAGERAKMANPLGLGGEAAARQLQNLEAQLGPERAQALRDAGDRFASYRQQYVVEPLVATGALSPELASKMLENREYVRFEVQRYIDDEALGRASGLGSLKGQLGTLQETGDPLIETVLTDMALVSMRQRAELASAAIDWMQSDFPTMIQPAETRWNGQSNVPVEPKDRDLGLFTYMREGKVEGVYLPKGLADTLENRWAEAHPALKAWKRFVHGPIRALLVTHNPAWAVFNLQRDVRQSAKNVYRGLGSLPKAIRDTSVAMFDVWRAGEQRLQEEVELMRGGAILPSGWRAWEPADLNPSDAFGHVLGKYGVLTDREHQRKVRHPLAKAFHTATSKLGEVSERAAKVAAYRHLRQNQENYGIDNKQVMEWVRNRAGTPNSLRVGELGRFVDAVFMFSNIAKEGWRSSWESAKDNPAEWALKTFLYDVTPRLMLAAAATGLMDDELEEVLGYRPGDVIARIPNSDKEMYTVVPLGLDKNGKAVYLRFPQDHLGQAVSSITWKVSQGMDPAELVAFAKSQLPWGSGSLHPAISATGMAVDYASGKNPHDDFRNRPVLPETVFEAGGARAHAQMAKAIWKEAGGSTLYNFNTETDREAMTALEKITELPWIGSSLQRFVKTSDYGLSEAHREITDPIHRAEAQAQLERDEAIKQALADAKGGQVDTGALYRKMKADGLKVGRYQNFRDRVEVLRIRTYGSRLERDLSYTTGDARKALEELN